MLTLLMSFAIPVCIVLVFRFLNAPATPSVHGIYKQPNKYYFIKFVYMYIYLRIRKLYIYLKRQLEVELGRSDDGTVHVHTAETVLEEKYSLDVSPMAMDGVHFNAMSDSGQAVICGLARRPNNVCDAFLYLKVDENEILLSPKLPDTFLKQEPSDEGEYRVQGITIVNFIPMRTWKVAYVGEMKRRNEEEKVNVEVELTWSAYFPPFNYNTHLSPRSLAQDISREKWSSSYFKLLKKLHQNYYEQVGILEGIAIVDGKQHKLNMPCLRNHHYALHHDWRNYHRYIIHVIFLETGDCISVTVMSQPAIISHLLMGFVCRKSNQAVLPIDSCDLQLYQHGENQILPRDYGFSFEAGGELFCVKIKVYDEEVRFIGKDRVAKMYQLWSTVKVNGVKGWCSSEWQFNNTTS